MNGMSAKTIKPGARRDEDDEDDSKEQPRNRQREAERAMQSCYEDYVGAGRVREMCVWLAE